MKKTLCLIAVIFTVSSTIFASEVEVDTYSHKHDFYCFHTRLITCTSVSSTHHDRCYTDYYVCTVCGALYDQYNIVLEAHTKRMYSARCDKSRHTYYYDCSGCGYNMGTTSEACPNPTGNCPMPLMID